MSDPGYADDATDTSAEDEAADAIAQRRAMDFMVRKAAQDKAAANPALAVRPALAPGAAPAGPLVNAPGRPTPRPAMPQDPASLAVPRFAAPSNPDAGAEAYYGYLDKMDAARIAAIKEANAPLIKYWEDATKALKDKRSGPTDVERLSQLSAAFFKPTQYRGFGATLGNVLPVLAEQEKAKREDVAQQADLLDKYKLGSVEALTKQNLATIPKDKSAALLAYMTKMAKGKGLSGILTTSDGKLWDKLTGAPIVAPDVYHIQQLLADPSPVNIRDFDLTHNRPGLAAYYLQQYGDQ